MEELQSALGIENLLADFENRTDVRHERPSQVEQLLRLTLRQADKNAVGLLRIIDAGAALITRDVGIVAEQILDDEITLLIEAVFCAIRPDDPRVRRADLTHRALEQDAAGRKYLVGRSRTGDQLVIGHDESVLGATVGIDDGTFTHVSYNVLA